MIQWIEVIKRDSGHVIERPSFGLVGIDKIYKRKARKVQGDVMGEDEVLMCKAFSCRLYAVHLPTTQKL